MTSHYSYHLPYSFLTNIYITKSFISALIKHQFNQNTVSSNLLIQLWVTFVGQMMSWKLANKNLTKSHSTLNVNPLIVTTTKPSNDWVRLLGTLMGYYFVGFCPLITSFGQQKWRRIIKIQTHLEKAVLLYHQHCVADGQPPVFICVNNCRQLDKLMTKMEFCIH